MQSLDDQRLESDSGEADKLLQELYQELRKLAEARLAKEKPGQTLQATALVHEAYMRLVGNTTSQRWASRGHFFAAAAEAMRRILVEAARRKKGPRRGGDRRRVALDSQVTGREEPAPQAELIDLDDALERLERLDKPAAQIVKLRYFAGLTLPQAAQVMELPLRTVERNWTYARTWLYRELSK